MWPAQGRRSSGDGPATKDPWHQDRQLARWRVLFGCAFIVAVLLNGSVFFLKRTGILEREAYRRYWVEDCATMSRAAGLLGAPCCCVRGPQQCLATTPEPPPERRGIMVRLYAYDSYELAPKAVKDGLIVGLLVFSAVLAARGVSPVPDLRAALPIWIALAGGALAFAMTAAHHGLLLATAGGRGLMFLPVALLAGWLMRQPGRLATSVGLLLVLEGVLVAYEVAYGAPIRSCPFPLRAAGTLDHPNSLGVFAACGLAFCAGFLDGRLRLIALSLVALFLVLAAASATGLVCLGLLGAVFGIQAASKHRRALMLGLAGVALGLVVAGLPALTGRADVFSSLLNSPARAAMLVGALRDRGGLDLSFGRGLGFATNAAKNLWEYRLSGQPPSAGAGRPVIADSTLTLLVEETGVVGLGLYVTLLAWASWRDRPLRVFYAVVAISSLTINVPEVFPVNLMLGLALAYTASLPEGKGVGSEA